MREILFRAKSDSTNPIWIYGSINLSYMPEINTSLIDNGENTYKCLPDTIGQYTGLTDKNGTKVFEGDIIKKGFEIFVVKWNSEQFRFDLYTSKNAIQSGFNVFTQNYFEVIGNIHDNSELLEGK